ncbi:hypothetical protein PIB30_047734 [Stylosanthes scabra]|uniref:Uncharacterized protein n=1 Tax=Stylosanthes scabra TaxID=79078 RepID=A0ABU6XEN7_9FABA|nr:hypothetical protein [Stylosanthes scabra]
MAGSNHFLTLLNSTSRSSLVKPNTTRPFFNNSTKNYGQATSSVNRSRMMEERAPSTAEEFERVAEEKSKNKIHEGAARNGNGDGAEHATNGGDSKVDSSPKRYKEY